MAGGEARLIFNAWRYGSDDPYRLYNRLDSEYRRVWNPELPALRPRHPDRLQAFVYACGKVAAIMDKTMDNTAVTIRKRKPSDPRRGRAD